MICYPSKRLLRLSLLLGLAALLGLTVWLMSANSNPVYAQCTGQHCYDTSMLSLPAGDDCGCTWGAVYVNLLPVAGAEVTMRFAGQTISTTTGLGCAEEYPYYAMSARNLGAEAGDWVRMTTTCNGRILTQTVQLRPDAQGEQMVPFWCWPGFPSEHVYLPLVILDPAILGTPTPTPRAPDSERIRQRRNREPY